MYLSYRLDTVYCETLSICSALALHTLLSTKKEHNLSHLLLNKLTSYYDAFGSPTQIDHQPAVRCSDLQVAIHHNQSCCVANHCLWCQFIKRACCCICRCKLVGRWIIQAGHAWLGVLGVCPVCFNQHCYASYREISCLLMIIFDNVNTNLTRLSSALFQVSVNSISTADICRAVKGNLSKVFVCEL